MNLKFILNKKMSKLSNQKYYWLLIFVPIFLFLVYLAEFNYLISVLVLSSLVFLFILFLKIEIGLYLIAISLPLIGIAFKISFLELPLVDLLGLFALLSFILREVYLYFYDKSKSKLVYPFFSYFLLFFSVCLLSSALSENIISSLWYSFRWILFFYLAFILMPINVVKNEKILRNILILISISSLLMSFSGLYSLYLQDWYDSFFRVQPIAIFNYWIFGTNYNLLSEILLCSGFLILSLKYWFKSERISKLINILSIVLLLTAWLTFGRTAWITIVLQTIIYFSIYFLVIKRKKIDPKSIALLLTVFLVIASPFIFKMFSLQEANISSTQNRLLLSEISVDAFKNKPLFGYGSGNFVNLVADNIRFVAKYGDPLDSHGVWQKILAENGVLGVIAFALFSFFIFKKLYFGILNNKKDFELLLPLFVASFGVYFYQFFNTSYYKGRVWLPVSLALIALILIERKKINTNKENV